MEYSNAIVVRAAIASTLGIVVSIRSYAKKSLSFSGALASCFVGAITFFCGNRFACTLLAFFFSASWVTKVGHGVKVNIEDEYKAGGQRTWQQVLANGGVGTILAAIYAYFIGVDVGVLDTKASYWGTALLAGYIGHYACCCGDTFASELGVLSAGSPRLILGFRKVPPGTNGAVSLLGTLASGAGGLIVGVAFFISQMLFIGREPGLSENGAVPQHSIIWLGAFAGFFGSMADSVLGQLIQYSGYDEQRHIVIEKPSEGAKHLSGADILSGDQVNFAASLICTMCTIALAVLVVF